MGNYEKGVDMVFSKAGDLLQKADKKGILVPTKLQNELSDMLNTFNASKNEIYKGADTIKHFLDGFEKEESANLVRALNADKPTGELNGKLLEAYKRIRALIDHNGDELVKAGLLNEKSRVKDYLKRYYESYLNDLSKVKKLFNEKKYKRSNLSYEERIALGMIEDASYVVPRTLAEQRIQLIKGKFLEAINEKYGADKALDDSYVAVEKVDVGGGVLKYGALSGRYIPNAVKQMLDDAHLLKQELGIAEKYLYPVIDHIKVNMTVKNPVTHIYNILSNIQVSAMNGTLGNAAKILHMMKHDKERFDALVKELEPFGLDSSLKDMEDVQLFTNSNKGVNIFMSIVQNAYMSENSKVGKTIRNVYDWEDKIFKVAAYDKLKTEQEMALGRSLSEPEKLDVYKEAVAPYGNYSTPLPAIFRILDKTGLSPFLHYMYKATPAVAKVIAKNPLKYAIIQIALLEAGASIWDEDDAIKPDWAGADSKINLFGVKDWVRFSNGWYWNAGRMMPGLKFGSIDLSGGILGGALRITNGETPLGYTIGSKYDSPAMQVWERVAALAENYAPPMSFGRYGQRVAKKLSGQEQKNYYKEDMGWDELGSRMMGVRKFNEPKEVAHKIKLAENRLKHSIKEDPQNEAKYQKEHDDTVQEIEKQARAKQVEMPASKSTFKKHFVEPIMPKQLVKL